MCEAGASKASRFREPKTDFEEDLVNKAVPTSTKYKNEWAANIFSEWQIARKVQMPVLDSGRIFKEHDLLNVGVLSTRIEEMDALSLNYLLRNFITEVAKKGGESYSPMVVYGTVCGVGRYLEEKDGSEAFTCNPFLKLTCEKDKFRVII